MKAVLACLVVLCAAFALDAADDDVVVEGYVHDSAGRPLKAIKVGLYAAQEAGPICDPVTTDADGYYKFNVKIVSTYSMMFSHTVMDPATIELLAEKKHQKVSIKMYKRGESRPATAYLDTLYAAEKWLFLAATRASNDRESVVREYKASGADQLIRAGKFSIVPQATQEARDHLNTKVRALVQWQTSLGIR